MLVEKLLPGVVDRLILPRPLFKSPSHSFLTDRCGLRNRASRRQATMIFFVRTPTATSAALQTTKSLTCVMRDGVLAASVIGRRPQLQRGAHLRVKAARVRQGPSKENPKRGCASSEGWCVQQEINLPGQESGAP